MIATTATHKMGDISRKTPDICIINATDKDNYYGHWVTGFGFIDVAFPKKTTHKLTADDIEKYHGMVIHMGNGLMGTINLKKENFAKRVVVTNVKTKEVRNGTLVAPVKYHIAMETSDGRSFCTSRIKSIKGNKVKTQNSTYMVEYL